MFAEYICRGKLLVSYITFSGQYPHELRIDMKINDQDVFAEYTTFRIEAESDKYVFSSFFSTFKPTKIKIKI